MNYVTLNNGVKMPQLGYGVYQVDPQEAERCVLDAIHGQVWRASLRTLRRDEDLDL